MTAGRPRKPENRSLPPGVYVRVRNGRRRFYDADGKALGSDPRKAALIVAQRAVGDDYTESTWLGASRKYRAQIAERLEAGKLSRATVDSYTKMLNRLDETLGLVRLDSIRPMDFARIMHAVEDRPATASQLRIVFQQVWKRALSAGLTEKADPSGSSTAPEVEARTVHVTQAMFDAVMAQADQVVRDWARLSVAAGQRVSDILSLRREHIVGSELRPPNTKTNRKGDKPIRIEMSGDLLEVVTELLNRPRRVSGPWLIQNERGGKVTYSALSQRWDRAYKRARELDPSIPEFQRRDLRAMSATSEQKTAQHRLGHTSERMTKRHYIREIDWSEVPLAKPGKLPKGGKG